MNETRREAIRRLHPVLVRILEARHRTTPPFDPPSDAIDIYRPLSGQAQIARSPQATQIHSITAIKRALSPECLERAFNRLLERHGALRTRYELDSHDQLWALTRAPRPSPLEVIDLTHVPSEARESHAREIARERIRHPFDIYSGPLVRLTLLRFAPTLFVRIFVVHHSIFDGASREIFFRDLDTLMGQEGTSGGQRLPEVLQFADYARRRERFLQSAQAHADLTYWRERLSNVRDAFWLPADRIRPFDDEEMLPLIRGIVRAPIVEALRRFARDQKTTLFLILLTAFAALMVHWSQKEDLLLWNFHDGRSDPDTKEAIGLFADCRLLRFTLAHGWRFSEAVEAVHASFVESLPHSHLPPTMLSPLLRRPGAVRFASTTFNFISHAKEEKPARAGEDEPMEWVDLPGRYRAGTPFALMMTVTERPGAIDWQIQHQSALFEDATIERLSARFGLLLAALARNQEVSLAALMGSFTGP